MFKYYNVVGFTFTNKAEAVDFANRLGCPVERKYTWNLFIILHAFI